MEASSEHKVSRWLFRTFVKDKMDNFDEVLDLKLVCTSAHQRLSASVHRSHLCDVHDEISVLSNPSKWCSMSKRQFLRSK